MSTVYNPHDPEYLDRLQAERDEHALGLTSHAGNTPLELAAGSRRESLMDELDRRKNQRAPELPPALAAHLAGNAARRRVAPLWDGPTAHEAVAGGARGDSTDLSTPMHPTTAHTLARLLRQQNNEQAASSVERAQGMSW